MEAVLNQVEDEEEVGMDTECDDKPIREGSEGAEQNHHVVTNDVVVRRWDAAQIEDRPAASPTPLSLRKVSNAFQSTMEVGYSENGRTVFDSMGPLSEAIRTSQAPTV